MLPHYKYHTVRKKQCAAENELYISCRMSMLNSLVGAEGRRRRA
jgi:hypothetical protein